MLSYWEQQSFFKDIDVAIIGSGIVGLNAAIRLKELDAKLNVMVIERSFLPYGASTRNAGFACFGSITELQDDLENTSETAVFDLVERRFKGLARLRQKIGDVNLRYHEHGGFEIFKTNEKATFEDCASQLSYFNRQVKHITGSDNTYQVLGKSAVQAFGFQGIGNAIVNKSEGQIDTGNMMKSLLQLAQTKGVSVMNGLIINKIEDDGKTVSLHTSLGWHFSAKKLLVCTNGFAKQLLPSLELMAARNQVIVTEPIPNLSLKGCFHYDKGYFYFRNIDKRILLGGGRNLDYETEKTDQFGTTPLIQMALEKLLSTIILPKQTVKIATVWSGILGLGNVKKPIIELVSPNVGVAVRMGGMGVAIGTLVGEDGAALIFKTI